MMTNAIDMPIGTERFVRMHHLVGGIRKGAKVDAVKRVWCFAIDYHFTALEIIDGRAGPTLKDSNELVFRTIKAALTGSGLVPDQKVFPFRIKGPCGAEQLMKVAPVHEDIVDSAISAGADGAANKAIEQSAERRARDLAGSHWKFSMAHFAEAHRLNVGVGDHHLGELALQQRFVSLAALGIATDQAMPAELPNVAKLG